MKKISRFLVFAVCALLLLILSCDKNTFVPVQTASAPGATPTATGAASSATVNATNTNVFSPASVTITQGGSVTFLNNSGVTHTLVIDNGSGTCSQIYNTWPQMIVFPLAGTFSFHCSIHSSCGSSVCSGCTGMTGQVVVQ